MAEDIKAEVKDDVLKNNEEKVEVVDTEQEAPDPVETRAREQGWRPLTEWEGEPADWRDARTFIDRGEFMSRISSQSKEIKKLQTTLKAYEDLNKKLAETKFNEKLAELKTAKVKALEDGEAGRVVELDEQIDMVRDSIAEHKASIPEPEVAAAELHPEFQRWVDKNSWYAQNAEMREFADALGTAYAKANRSKSPTEVLTHVEGRVKKAYSEMFANTKREAPQAVEGGEGTRRTTRGKGFTEADLPADARRVMDTLVSGGHMSKDEYLKQYALMNK